MLIDMSYSRDTWDHVLTACELRIEDILSMNMTARSGPLVREYLEDLISFSNNLRMKLGYVIARKTNNLVD